jgi:LysM repeat protein
MIVVVAPGDTLSGIAERYDATLAAVLAANPQIADPALIRPGDRIAVPRPIANQLVWGTHDAVPASIVGTREGCHAFGWASDLDDRTADVTVRILIDGHVRASVVANEYREDLAQFAIGWDGTASFAVDLSGLVTPDVAHEVRVQAQDLQTHEWLDLNLTPRTLTCPATGG